MKYIKKIYRFLGSIYLAILLIALATIMVIAGTVIESLTDSHLLAAKWTYHHPFFILLLCFFFINILVSALHRWPFKWRHIPFLLTHLGLLMILAGTILKNQLGLQGNLSLLEGSSSHHVNLTHTHALAIENPLIHVNIPLPDHPSTNDLSSPLLPELNVKVMDYYPHVQEKIETWIKKDHLFIIGQKSLPVRDWHSSFPLMEFDKVHFEGYEMPWEITAVKTSQLAELIKAAYLHHLTIQIHSRDPSNNTLKVSLEKILNFPIKLKEGTITVNLLLSYLNAKGFDQPKLTIDWQSDKASYQEQTTIHLVGPQALISSIDDHSYDGIAKFEIDLQRPNPLLIFAQDEQENVHLLFFDCHGRVHAQVFPSNKLENFISYNGGYAGYAVQAAFPFPPFNTSRKDKEEAILQLILQQIEATVNQTENLSPPLKLFRTACEKAQVEFAPTFIAYLIEWKKSGQLLFSQAGNHPDVKKVIKNLSWENENEDVLQACQWTCLLFDRIESMLLQKKEIQEILEINHWPIQSDALKQIKPADFLKTLSQQIFSFSTQLPLLPKDSWKTLDEKACLLSAYLKAHEIDYQILSSSVHQLSEKNQNEFELFSQFNKWKPTVIETPVTATYLRLKSPEKLEDCQPCVLLEISEGKHKEQIALAYHPIGMKWPVLNGNYKIRYQAQSVEIPYSLRLRQAREIHYPHTQQPYSYECDILISQPDNPSVSQTLSMNTVYETWDGFRFYLSGMNTISNQSLKSVQIVVNYDPTKYFLTYPGCIIIFLGIVLLFWFKR